MNKFFCESKLVSVSAIICAICSVVATFSIGIPGETSVSELAQPAQEKQDDDPHDDPHEDLDAILWVQTSAEYRAIARQTFRAARAAVGEALVDPAWTASTEQMHMADFGKSADWLSRLPPAVVVDVDETVLDNSKFQVGLIDNDGEYSRDGWKAFVNSKVSTPIDGAVEFVRTCRAAGVTVFFVTNREHEVEGATRENLIAAGLMKADDPDLILTKNEKKEWTSDKMTRRVELANEYRILLLMGDDLNDFVATEYHALGDQRRKMGEKYKDWFGERWFCLPNPNYGGWEQASYGWKNAISVDSKRKRKRENLKR